MYADSALVVFAILIADLLQEGLLNWAFPTLNVTQVKVGPDQLPGDCPTAHDTLSPVTQVCLDGLSGRKKMKGEIAGNAKDTNAFGFEGMCMYIM